MLRPTVLLLMASAAGAQTFDFATTKPALYTAETGYGLEEGSQVTAGGGCLTSPRPPFYFSVKVPAEGNYKVTVKLGAAHAATVTTVKAELRRLMLERVRTEAGHFETRSFIVNVRTPRFPEGEVRLKEFSDSYPSVCSIAIEKAGNIPTIYIAGDSTSTDQPVEPYNSWGQIADGIEHGGSGWVSRGDPRG